MCLENKLTEKYREVFKLPKNKPDWAVKKNDGVSLVHPAIPFIGKKYSEAKVLLYASAENLVRYNGYLDIDSNAIKRRRDTYNLGLKEREKDKDKYYFPNIHIKPIEDGSLLTAAAYILKIIGKTFQYNDPYEFIEHIAVDNFCKFSIENGNRNKDYAGKINKVRYSFDYIKADLKLLKPEIIILPKTIYNLREVKQIIKDIVPNSLRIPIYQINSRNINHPERIKKYFLKNEKSTIDKDLLVNWQKRLKNGTNKNYNGVYTYLENVVKNVLPNLKLGSV